jgi:Zn-dependent protease/predicted transcriptional regulator
MTEAIRLGKLAGIRLSVHWSVLVILWLFTWSLASTLPHTAPGHSAGAYWLAGLAGALLLLASLVGHELMHAVLARRAGVKVSGVTLWLFGGITRLGGEAPTPRAEFHIAASGPAVSLGLAAAFGVVAKVLDVSGVPLVVVAVAWWLSGINLLLGIFNLLPGAPMDGGRILRAYLWHRHGDKVRATLGAARSGRILAFTLIAVGLMQFLLGWLVGGVWTAFIGWFVFTAAQEEQSRALTTQALAGVRVADAMTSHPRTVPGWITVEDFVQRYLLGEHHSAYPVEDPHGSVVGLISLAQVRRVPPAERISTLVQDAAVPMSSVPTATPDEPLITLLERLTPHTGDRVLVVNADRVVGIVTARDITRLIDVRRFAAHP